MKNLTKIFKGFGSTTHTKVIQQSKTTQTSTALPQYINQKINQWPSWLNKQKTIQKKGQYKTAISYQLVQQIPKAKSISRSHSKSYSYYIDKQHQLVQFYPINYGLSLKQIVKRPSQEQLFYLKYDSDVHYQSIKIVPMNIAIEQLNKVYHISAKQQI